jgi:hypothetical protein
LATDAVEERFRLHLERRVRAQDARHELQEGLDGPLGPAVLLALERVHLDRQLGRRHVVGQEDELPAPELGAVAEVEILGQRVVLPPAAVADRLAAPDAGGAVEVEEAAAAVAAPVLEDEVRVEQDRLDLGEERVVLVDVAPAGLHQRHLGVGEIVDRALQEVGLRDEVGVEDRDELPAGDLHGLVERPGLVAGAVGAVDVLDVQALRGVAAHGELGDLPGFVGGVVEHLDLQELPRVVDPADGVDETIDDVHLVEERQLDGHHRQGVELRPGGGHVVLVLHV